MREKMLKKENLNPKLLNNLMPSEFIICCDCKGEFEHDERDQQFYVEKGFEPPKRCRPCRLKKKSRYDKGQGSQIYPVAENVY